MFSLLRNSCRTLARPSSRQFSYQRALTLENMNPLVRGAEYAVRGRQVMLAGQLEAKLGQENHGLPFDKIIYCNIGNPQNLGQKPITFHRQVMSMLSYPPLLEQESTRQLFPSDAVERAEYIMSQNKPGIGQYTHSQGLQFARESVANFITERDGIPSDPSKIFLSNGASEGIARVMQTLIRAPGTDGILCPIPQYPLYSATCSLLGAPVLPYYLQEDNSWGLEVAQLEAACADAQTQGITPRGLVVINPGNPTGQVLSKENMEQIVEFCHRNSIVLLADEVYQANIYNDRLPFHSFKKVAASMPADIRDNVELVSFHSTSKGFLGECGYRGGYMELCNIDEDVQDELLKLFSMVLCSNASGQVMVELMVNPPRPGQPSYDTYAAERDGILSSLKRRADSLAASLNAMEGISCNQADGAMYVFPRVQLPQGAVSAAAKLGTTPDALYAEELLMATGICVVPGSGFGQEEGTFHFRTTFLPPEQEMDQVVGRFGKFHAEFLAKYA